MLNKLSNLVGIVIMFLILVPGASAGVKNINKEKSQTNKNELDYEPHNQDAQSQIRCWQYGKLIFDERGWEQVNKQTKNNTIEYRHENNSNLKLNLISVGHSTCLFKKMEK